MSYAEAGIKATPLKKEIFVYVNCVEILRSMIIESINFRGTINSCICCFSYIWKCTFSLCIS
jgi:hypothetical protein